MTFLNGLKTAAGWTAGISAAVGYLFKFYMTSDPGAALGYALEKTISGLVWGGLIYCVLVAFGLVRAADGGGQADE